MAGALLDTKLHRPTRRRSLVARPRLGERLAPATESALTLISAPAGFGKTTLLAEWLTTAEEDEISVAWLSLDERDNTPAVFWSYLVAALRVAEPSIGAGAVTLLEGPRPPLEEALTSLLNDINDLPAEIVLVLDDYHLIEDSEIHQQVVFLLEHRPPRLHLVISGRADPRLPLARLRAAGELVEIRAADLRFRPDEAAAYLNEVMGLQLTARDLSALEARTEGWIAALQLAALSLQDRDDMPGFIAAFAGTDRYIVDYLAQEVLQRQPEHIRHFLLQTSILDRLCGPLCDAVTGHDGATATLMILELANLFLVPLDDHRHWYRYHQLFADVLRAYLEEEFPRDVPELHDRASRWFEKTDAPAEAIGHALASGNVGRAADLVELAIPRTRTSRQEAVLLGWLKSLPDEVLRARPVLSVGYAGTLLAIGERDGVEVRLRDAEAWIAANTGSGKWPDVSATAGAVVDSEEFRRLPASVAVHRAGLALVLGDPRETVRHARRVLEVAAEDDDVNRAAAAALLGLTFWASGDLEAAYLAYTECSARLMRAGYVADTLGCAIVLADIRLTQGRLGEAGSIYEQALRDSSDQEEGVLRGTADMHVGLSEIYRERGDLAGAIQQLTLSEQLGEHLGLPQNRYRWRVAMARIRQAEGDLDTALDLLNEADLFYVGDFSPNVRPVPALRARLRIARGEWREALSWARGQGLTAGDEVSYLHEFEHITLARALLAQHTAEQLHRPLDEATGLIGRLLTAAEAGHRIGTVIELLILKSLSEQANGDNPAALAALHRALSLAEPEGYLRIFVDEGPPMASLLRNAVKQRNAPSYARRLLAHFGPTKQQPSVQHGLIEPLSTRELEVLRLLGTDLDGPDIARELSVSLATVRTHSQHIYAKLGVSDRRAAVRRARDLEVLPRSRHH